VYEVRECDVFSVTYGYLVVDPMILDGTADITKLVSVKHQVSAAGSRHKLLAEVVEKTRFRVKRNIARALTRCFPEICGILESPGVSPVSQRALYLPVEKCYKIGPLFKRGRSVRLEVIQKRTKG